MLVPYTNLYDEVLPDVPGVPQAVARNAIRNACIEFCDKSHIWVVDHDPISAVAHESTYQFEPPAGAVVSRIETAWWNGVEITPTTQANLKNEYRNWTTIEGTPTRYLQENSEEVIVFAKPASAQTDALTMKVSLKPTRASNGIEGWIVEKYLEELAHGAKRNLYGMMKKPWSDASISAAHAAKFESAIDSAKLTAAKGLGKAKLRITPQYF